jgi:Fe-S cluster assembly protein SufD
VNGYFCPHLSDEIPDGVSFISLSDAVSSQDSSLEWIGGIHAPYPQGYKHLNAVMCRDGVILKIEKNTHIQRPIQVIFKNVTADSAVYSRCLVVLEQGANATVMVRHDNIYNTHENHVTECYLAQDSDLTMIKTIMDTGTYHHIGTVSATLDKNANINLAYYITGGDYCRYETNIYLNGYHANVNIGSAVLASDKNTCEHISTVIHTIPECTSSQMFQSLCDADGKITVQSKTIVMRDAQKTDAKQMLRGFLMHENAHIFAKPELEIYADDVKCSHGSTIGQLDKDALYYMRARGMDYATAKSLLTHSLVEQALAVIKNDDITDILLNHFADKIKN